MQALCWGGAEAFGTWAGADKPIRREEPARLEVRQKTSGDRSAGVKMDPLSVHEGEIPFFSGRDNWQDWVDPYPAFWRTWGMETGFSDWSGKCICGKKYFGYGGGFAGAGSGRVWKKTEILSSAGGIFSWEPEDSEVFGGMCGAGAGDSAPILQTGRIFFLRKLSGKGKPDGKDAVIRRL